MFFKKFLLSLKSVLVTRDVFGILESLGLSLIIDNILRIVVGLLYLMLNVVCLFNNSCYGEPLENQYH